MKYEISGKVVKGDGYGRKLGFPTANLTLTEGSLEDIRQGVYAGKAYLKDKEYHAGIVIDPEGKVEAHLLGFSGDLYGEMLTLKLEKYLREYRHFNTEEALIEQIKEDIKQC